MLMVDKRYVINHYRNGAKIQVTGRFLGENILGHLLLQKGKKIIDIPRRSILKIKQIIL